MADVLVDDAPRRLRRLGGTGGGLLVALVVGGGALRGTLPPAPLDVRVAGVSGTALSGESFVRVHLTLEAQGARDLSDAVLTVAGTATRGQHLRGFDDGRLTVQVDITPQCASLEDALRWDGALPDGAGPPVLDLRLHDAGGQDRAVRVEVPEHGRLERLLRYRCR